MEKIICTTCSIEKSIEEMRRGKRQCKQCINQYRREYYAKNKEKEKVRNKKWYSENKDFARTTSHNWYELNKEESLKKSLSYNKIYKVNRTRKDPMFALRLRVRSQIKNFLKAKNPESTKGRIIVGCNLEDFISHIESLFDVGMDWSNKGEWVFSFSKPLSDGKTPEEIIELCHFTNIVPIWKDSVVYRSDYGRRCD